MLGWSCSTMSHLLPAALEALTIAGMVAEGKTILNDVYNIDRGYENIEDKFSRIGAVIKRVTE